MKDGCLIIVSHGSKNKVWVKHVKKLTFSLKKKFGKTRVHAAYLENVKPDLKTILYKLASIKTITILPLFISCGNHITNDIKKDIIKYKKRYKNTKVKLLPSIGEFSEFKIFTEKVVKKYIC